MSAVVCSQIDLNAVHWLNQPYDNFVFTSAYEYARTGLNWALNPRRGLIDSLKSVRVRFSQSQSSEMPIPQPLRRHKTQWFEAHRLHLNYTFIRRKACFSTVRSLRDNWICNFAWLFKMMSKISFLHLRLFFLMNAFSIIHKIVRRIVHKVL